MRKSVLYKFTNKFNIMCKYLSHVFPKVDKEIERWSREIKSFHSEELAYQAMSSIKNKKFHCQGGSIYSLYPGCDVDNMVGLIVALQTISDYLDNLCDRTEVKEEKAFRQLHLAFIEALQPGGNISEYYLHYPYKEDGGYLNKLVSVCRASIAKLPSYNKVESHVISLGHLYSELQIYKHLPVDIREKKVVDWTLPYLQKYKGVTSWEFAAATGSTLAIFMMFAVSSDSKCSDHEVLTLLNVYFPWVCGLHILLDYYIDLKEDLYWGDLNFVSYYSGMEVCEQRLKHFVKLALEEAKKLRHSYFHTMVIQGLLALYLSDTKAYAKEQTSVSRGLIDAGGKLTHSLWNLCRLLRKKGYI